MLRDGKARPMTSSCVSHRGLPRVFGLVALVAGAAQACPTDAAPRTASTLLTVQGAGLAPQVLTATDLAALPAVSLTLRQSVSSGPGADTERSVTYSGHLLRDLLLNAGLGGPADRAARVTTVELVATDGYRAVFSWGELFNTAIGDRVLVITAQDGRPLDSVAGPTALRSLADLRSGPRHVRNLCAVIVRRFAGG
jgi:hypothetical protein